MLFLESGKEVQEKNVSYFIQARSERAGELLTTIPSISPERDLLSGSTGEGDVAVRGVSTTAEEQCLGRCGLTPEHGSAPDLACRASLAARGLRGSVASLFPPCILFLCLSPCALAPSCKRVAFPAASQLFQLLPAINPLGLPTLLQQHLPSSLPHS